jgi:hypothetical protein
MGGQVFQGVQQQEVLVEIPQVFFLVLGEITILLLMVLVLVVKEGMVVIVPMELLVVRELRVV